MVETALTKASFDTGPFDAACGVAQDMLRRAQSLLRMRGIEMLPLILSSR